MPIPNEYIDVIVMLADATKEGRVKWRVGRSGASVSVAGSHFEIWAGTDEETERPFVSVGIRSPDGKQLETWFVDRGDQHYDVMRELHDRARRQALGVPERLASIKEALTKGGAIGDDETNADDDIP